MDASATVVGGNWPTGVDYIDAVQARADHLGHDAVYAEGTFGIPQTAHGRHAIVFRFDRPEARPVAFRCFTSAQPDAEHRYRTFDTHLRRHPIDAFPSVIWMDQGIDVDDATWPALQMEWIDGQRLDRWISSQLESGAAEAVAAMAERWRVTARDVAAAGVGHGDYQHGNIMIDGDDRIRLVDLDGMWVPGLADAPSPECGHEAYQHPGRRTAGMWCAEIDGFSALLIWMSLRAVAADPSLWADRDEHDDHLVLEERDLLDSTRPVWSRLDANPDPIVPVLASRLRRLLAGDVAGVPGVDQALADPELSEAAPAAAGRCVDRPDPGSRSVRPVRSSVRRRAATLVVAMFALVGVVRATSAQTGGDFIAGGAVDVFVVPPTDNADATSSPTTTVAEPSGADAAPDDGDPGIDDPSPLPVDAESVVVPPVPDHLEVSAPGADSAERAERTAPPTTTVPPPVVTRPPATVAPTTTTVPPTTTSAPPTTTSSPPTTTVAPPSTTNAPPQPALAAAIAASTLQVEVGTAVTFDGSPSTGDPDSYLWDWSYAGRTATGQVVTYAWPEPGTYTVTLTVARGESTDSTTVSVLVVAPAVAVPNLVGLQHTQAREAVESAGLEAWVQPVRNDSVPLYTVVSQDVSAGAMVAEGSRVTFYVADTPYCDANPGEFASCDW